MSILKDEPPQPVRSIEELFAIAHAMEHEAATRYSEIAARLRTDGNPVLAELFERLAAEERGHLDSVVQWSEKQKGKAPDPALVRWHIPETFDDEGAGTTDPRLLTAYRSLSMAVRNEERAFAFWSYVAAHAANLEIREAAETMAFEELEHVAALRSERRRSYHAERLPIVATGDQTLTALDNADLERRLADLLEQLAGASGASESSRIRQLANEARESADELTRTPVSVSSASGSRVGIPDDPVVLSEMLVDRYLEAAEDLRDEKGVARAQTLAGRAINRLAWLRADLPELGAGA